MKGNSHSHDADKQRAPIPLRQLLPHPQAALELAKFSSKGTGGVDGVSILLTGYDNTAALTLALQSIREQALPSVQIVIVGEERTLDSTSELALPERVTFVSHDPETYEASARQAGLSAATEPFVAYLEQGDLWHPGHLAEALYLFDTDSRIGLVIGELDVVESDPLSYTAKPSISLSSGASRKDHSQPWPHQEWTISGIVARAEALQATTEGSNFLFDRSEHPVLDSSKWSHFLAMWQVAHLQGKAHPLSQEELFELLYDELHGLAARKMSGQSADHTLQATALVNELYLKLTRSHPSTWTSRKHFLAYAAGAMRHILVDHARGKSSLKRKAPGERLNIEVLFQLFHHGDVDLIALDEALEALAEREPELAELVELHFFGGCSFEEIARMQNKPLRVVLRDWKFARAWLHRRLRETG